MSHPLKNANNEKKIANPNNFSTKIFDTFYLRKCIPTLDVFVRKQEDDLKWNALSEWKSQR